MSSGPTGDEPGSIGGLTRLPGVESLLGLNRPRPCLTMVHRNSRASGLAPPAPGTRNGSGGDVTLGDMSQLFQHAQKMQKEMRTIQDELKKRNVVGEAGGGMVKVYVNGQQQVLKVEIEKEAVDPEEVGMLEDLILMAVKSGIEKSQELSRNEMAKVTGGMQLPGLF